jgi:hypothetical protein
MHNFLGPSDPKLTHSIPRRPLKIGHPHLHLMGGPSIESYLKIGHQPHERGLIKKVVPPSARSARFYQPLGGGTGTGFGGSARGDRRGTHLALLVVVFTVLVGLGCPQGGLLTRDNLGQIASASFIILNRIFVVSAFARITLIALMRVI